MFVICPSYSQRGPTQGVEMLNDDEMLNLSEDPEWAFVEYERLVRERTNQAIQHGRDSESDTSMSRVDYISHVLAAARYYELRILEDWQVPSSNSNDIYEIHLNFLTDVNFATTQIRLKHARRQRRYSVALDPKTKSVIRHHLATIKELVDRLDVPEKKRNRLYAKINALENEVDRDRTRFDALMALILEGSSATGKAAENLEPVTKRIREITEAFGKVKEEEEEHTQQLPAPEERKRIEPPRPRLVAPRGARTGTMDDEIPF